MGYPRVLLREKVCVAARQNFYGMDGSPGGPESTVKAPFFGPKASLVGQFLSRQSMMPSGSFQEYEDKYAMCKRRYNANISVFSTVKLCLEAQDAFLAQRQMSCCSAMWGQSFRNMNYDRQATKACKVMSTPCVDQR